MSVPLLLLFATALPLASFLILIFFGRRIGYASGWVGTGAMTASCAISVWALVLWAGRMGQVQTP